jgi:hypothetical protein
VLRVFLVGYADGLESRVLTRMVGPLVRQTIRTPLIGGCIMTGCRGYRISSLAVIGCSLVADVSLFRKISQGSLTEHSSQGLREQRLGLLRSRVQMLEPFQEGSRIDLREG